MLKISVKDIDVKRITGLISDGYKPKISQVYFLGSTSITEVLLVAPQRGRPPFFYTLENCTPKALEKIATISRNKSEGNLQSGTTVLGIDHE